jgi:hypothetical protein
MITGAQKESYMINNFSKNHACRTYRRSEARKNTEKRESQLLQRQKDYSISQAGCNPPTIQNGICLQKSARERSVAFGYSKQITVCVENQ